MSPEPTVLSRRQFVGTGALAAAALAFGPSFWRDALAAPTTPGAGPYGPLNAPDANGLMLPNGFQLARDRPLGRSGGRLPVARLPGRAGHLRHRRTGAGSWSRTQSRPPRQGGGASAIEFGPDGSIRRAYRILGDTDRNCSGGPTPWGTYLSCEEWDGGHVWECDPTGRNPAVMRPAMGTFTHESACVDPVGKRVYMTEDEDDGRLYRFTPSNYPDLSSGVLELATVGSDGGVSWQAVPDPSAISAPTREQVAGTRFAGGEGMWFDSGIVYFTTKKDNKVHAYDTRSGRYELIYDEATTPGSPLSGLDGITVSRSGDLYLCEDGDDLDVCMITPERVVSRFLTLTGAAHATQSSPASPSTPPARACTSAPCAASARGRSTRCPGRSGVTVPRAAPIVIGATPAPIAEEEPKPAVSLRAPRRMGLSARCCGGASRCGSRSSEPGTLSLAVRTGEVLAAQEAGRHRT